MIYLFGDLLYLDCWVCVLTLLVCVLVLIVGFG